MRVLVIDRAPPIDPRQGNALIGLEVFTRMEGHDLTLVAPATPSEMRDAPRVLRDVFRRIHLVPRASRLPALAGWAEAELARRLPAAPGFDLAASRALAARIRDTLRADRFDVIHVRQLPMAPHGRLATDGGRLLELIDSETIGSERARPRSLRTRVRARAAGLIERRAMRGYDAVTTVAKADAQRLLQLSPRARVEVVPNGVDVETFHPPTQPEGNPPTLAFVGAMSFPPNAAAMRWFVERVMPLITQSRPDVRLEIVGRDPGPEVRALGTVPGVDVIGEVDDVRPYATRASVIVVPMVSGSGIKNKVLEAMAMARPVVATSLAVEGLPVEHGRHLAIQDDAPGFAAAVLDLIAHDDRRRAMGTAARDLVAATYTWTRTAERYDALYQELGRRGARA